MWCLGAALGRPVLASQPHPSSFTPPRSSLSLAAYAYLQIAGAPLHPRAGKHDQARWGQVPGEKHGFVGVLPPSKHPGVALGGLGGDTQASPMASPCWICCSLDSPSSPSLQRGVTWAQRKAQDAPRGASHSRLHLDSANSAP